MSVWEAILPLLDYWFEMGVDGMRLDAIPYLYEREGTSCENLPETHKFLKALRQHVDAKFPGRMFLAEANQWPEDAVAYFGDGDECLELGGLWRHEATLIDPKKHSLV